MYPESKKIISSTKYIDFYKQKRNMKRFYEKNAKKAQQYSRCKCKQTTTSHQLFI